MKMVLAAWVCQLHPETFATEHYIELRLLGPLETANGMLLFGVSTAMVFAVMLWLIQVRFKDLKD